VAAALRPGGVYVLDLGFVQNAGDPVTTTSESWEETRDGVTVRGENKGVTVIEASVRRHLAWGTGDHLRGYTTRTFAERVAACPGFALESWHPAASEAAGDTRFSISGQPPAAVLRRAMVVLRRI